MASRQFTISKGAMTVANAAVTLLFINPSATVGFRVLRAWVSQSGTPAANQQPVQLVTQVTSFPTLTSVTPSRGRMDEGAASASGIVGGTAGAAGTCGVNASAEGAGAKTEKINDSFHISNGWLWLPTDKEQIALPAAAAFGLGIFLPVAPTTLTGWVVGLTYEELG